MPKLPNLHGVISLPKMAQQHSSSQDILADLSHTELPYEEFAEDFAFYTKRISVDSQTSADLPATPSTLEDSTLSRQFKNTLKGLFG